MWKRTSGKLYLFLNDIFLRKKNFALYLSLLLEVIFNRLHSGDTDNAFCRRKLFRQLFHHLNKKNAYMALQSFDKGMFQCSRLFFQQDPSDVTILWWPVFVSVIQFNGNLSENKPFYMYRKEKIWLSKLQYKTKRVVSEKQPPLSVYHKNY